MGPMSSSLPWNGTLTRFRSRSRYSSKEERVESHIVASDPIESSCNLCTPFFSLLVLNPCWRGELQLPLKLLKGLFNCFCPKERLLLVNSCLSNYARRVL